MKALRFGRLPVAVAVSGVALALAVGATAQISVKSQEHRLLSQEAVDANAYITTLFMGVQASLQVLNGDGLPTRDEVSDYIARPGPLGGRTVAVVSARPEPRTNDMVVAAASGRAPLPGQVVKGERAAVLTRAAATRQLTTALLHDGGHTTLLLAYPSQDAGGVFLSSQESVVHPSTPLVLGKGAPFADLHGALYAGPPRPENLILATDRRLPLRGAVVRSSLHVGDQAYTTTVAPGAALAGSLDRAIPALLFAGGVITAALATAIALVLSRRRDTAIALAHQRATELAETHDFLEGILTTGPLVVARRCVSTNTVTYVSPNVEQVLGYPPDVARQRGLLLGSLHPDDVPAFESAVRTATSGQGRKAQVESRVRVADGQYRWVSTILVGESEAGQEPDSPDSYVVEYVLDVDDRHREELLRRDSQRLAEEAQTRAEEASQHKSDFLSHMSHELRTPLNAVLGFAQLLQADVTDESQQEEISQILDGGNHLLALINELLDIAKIEAGHLTLSIEEVDPAQLVNETLDLMRPLAAQREIAVECDLDGCDGWVLRADRQRAKQVLLNLLSNAVKYNHVGGSIAVTARSASDSRAAIAVTDTGPGIEPDKLERLFEPFERVGAEYSGVDGAGIGLAVARQLSLAMGATLTVSTAVGSGCTFSVEFGATPAPAGAADAATLDSATAERIWARPVVLYIEDDAANLTLVERLVAKNSRFRLVGATKGTLGLQLAHGLVPALILLDLNLPDIRGEEVLERLRADPVTAGVPVVVLSADATQSRVEHLLAEGAAAYLTKPVVLNDVLRLINETTSDQSRCVARTA